MTDENAQSPFGVELDKLAAALSDAGLIGHPGSLEAAFGLSALAVQISAALERHFASLGLSHSRFSVLLALTKLEETPSTSAELAKTFGVSKPTMTDILKVLERDGWIDVAPSTTDKRVKNISMSTRGRAAFQRLLPVHYQRLSHLNGSWDERQSDEIVELVGRLLPDYQRFAREVEKQDPLEFAPNKEPRND